MFLVLKNHSIGSNTGFPLQLFDQWQPLPPKQQSRRLSADVWTTVTPCCTAYQTACGRFRTPRTSGHRRSTMWPYHAGAASAALAACPSSPVQGCMPGKLMDSDRRSAAARTRSSHGRSTTSAIEASVLQAPACGTVYRRTCDETWTSRVSSVNWKHFYSGVSQPQRIVTVCYFCALEILLLTYLERPGIKEVGEKSGNFVGGLR